MSSGEPPRDVHRSVTRATSAVLFVLGVVMVVSTIARGGGPLAVGVIVGICFALVGAGRLYITTLDGATPARRRRRPAGRRG